MPLIHGTRLDVSAGPLGVHLHHSDVFGDDNVAGENNVTLLGGFGFATRFSALPGLTVGAGLFTQGGFGTDYPNLNTAFGTRDRTSSFLRYLKFAVGLSYELTSELSIGVAPSVGYSDISLRLFPNTSVAPSSPPPSQLYTNQLIPERSPGPTAGFKNPWRAPAINVRRDAGQL